MEHTIEDNKLIIPLPERVNESNAAQLKTDITKLVSQYPSASVVIDCNALKYISSSGLRALLSVQKKKGKDPIVLKNVHKEVNEILEMTGFDDIFHVSKTLRQCSIEGCEQIATSTNGALYSLKKGIMVKVFQKDCSLEDVEQELKLTQKALACGIPTPISFSTVRCGEQYGILFEELHASSLAQLLIQNPRNVVVYAKKLAALCKELHQTEILPGALPDIKQRYRDWLDRAKGRVPQDVWNQIKAMVEHMSDANTFVHGDLNLSNVFIVDDEFMLIDMGSCGYGHPIFDLQSLYASLVAIEIDKPGYCEQTMGLNSKICRDFWKSFMRYYLEEDQAGADATVIMNGEVSVKQTKMNQLLAQYYILKEVLLDELRVQP